jgi:glycosyltransferase involved in cell wall biosynthesis
VARLVKSAADVRILYVQPAEGFGGAERQSVVLIRRLRELGHDVFPFVGPGQPIRDALESAGITDYVFTDQFPKATIEPLKFRERLRRGVEHLLAWRRAGHAALEAAHTLGGIDLVFASRPLGWAAGGMVARRLGVPIVWRCGSMPTSRAQAIALRWLGRLFPPDALIANANALESLMAGMVKVPSAVIRNGVDLDRFNPRRTAPVFRSALGLENAPVIGVAARPHPDKGFDLLADVVERVSQREPQARVLVAGDDSWRLHYQRRFRERGLGMRVTFLGHVGQMETFYRSCDVVALPSQPREESLPNAVLEAMAMERPFVATTAGHLREVITPGEQGLLTPPDDADGFAGHLVRLLRDETSRRRMGAAGRATVVAQFDDRAIARKLVGLLDAVCRASGHIPAPALRAPQAAVTASAAE